MKFIRMFSICLAVIIVFIAAYLIIKPLVTKDRQAIDFSGATIDGKVISLSDNYGKTGTVLCFFDPQTTESIELVEQLVDTANGRADIMPVCTTELDQQ